MLPPATARAMHVGQRGMGREGLALVPDSSQTFNQNGGWNVTIFSLKKVLAFVLLPATRSSENGRARRYAQNCQK